MKISPFTKVVFGVKFTAQVTEAEELCVFQSPAEKTYTIPLAGCQAVFYLSPLGLAVWRVSTGDNCLFYVGDPEREVIVGETEALS